MKENIDYSVVMLVENDEVDCTVYLHDLHEQLNRLGHNHELILALNGANTFALSCLDKWPRQGPEVLVIKLNQKVASGNCLQALTDECRGEKFIVCGPNRQVTDEGFEALLHAVDVDGADLALPWRQNRVDSTVNQWQSHLFNFLVHRMTGVHINDLNSSIRVLRRSVLTEVPFHGSFYRFLPLLAKKKGYKVCEVPCAHIQLVDKARYFGLRVYVTRFLELLVLHFNLNFARKPLRYFGLRGSLIALAGTLCVLNVIIFKLAGIGDVGKSPLLIVGLTLILAGSGLWGVGLLGEILVFTLGRKYKDYAVEKILE